MLTFDTISDVITEIAPENAQISGGGNAYHAIDSDFTTEATAVIDSDSGTWLSISLGRIYCIKNVTWFKLISVPHHAWTCKETECLCTSGNFCHKLDLTVHVIKESTDSMPVDNLDNSNCKLGDTITLKRIDAGEFMAVLEITVMGYIAG